MNPPLERGATALGWFLRLPLLGAYELAMLMDEDEEDARRLIAELSDAGWLEYGVVSSPEVEPDRLFFVSAGGLSVLASALDCSTRALTDCLPVGARNIRACWQRVEITVGVNRFLAEMVAATRRSSRLRLASMLHLPRCSRQPVWFPRDVEAYVCLRVGQTYAPFFVAWDRAGAPIAHRRKRISAWHDFRRSHQPWGYEGMPSIAVLGANPATSRQWEQALLSAGANRDEPSLPALVTEIDSLFSADPLDVIWRAPLSRGYMPLAEQLRWRQDIPDQADLAWIDGLRAWPSCGEFVPPLAPSETVGHAPHLPNGGHRPLGVTDTRILDWLGYHPLLTESDLAALTTHRLYQVRPVLAKLSRQGLVSSVDRRYSADDGFDTFHFLSRQGLCVLADRDGVPPRRMARHGRMAAEVPGWKGSGRFETLLREFEHTVGCNRFFVGFSAGGRSNAFPVARWLSPSDSATPFTFGGKAHWLRPDGAADVQTTAGTRRVLLEWDRGTLHAEGLKEKWHVYADYFASLLAAEDSPESMPCLLVVTTTSQREQRIWSMISSAFEAAGVTSYLCATSLLPLVEKHGPWAPIWREGLAAPRIPVLGSDSSGSSSGLLHDHHPAPRSGLRRRFLHGSENDP